MQILEYGQNICSNTPHLCDYVNYNVYWRYVLIYFDYFVYSYSCKLIGAPLQSVQLTSTLFNGDVAYEGQQVNFTCITRGTDDILTWSSDHYIDDVLQVGFHDGPGFTEYSLRNPSTVATLISATTNDELTVIESRLQITASVQNPISNVSCRINSHGPVSTITFRKERWIINKFISGFAVGGEGSKAPPPPSP